MANAYSQPQKGQFMQTYVSQHVPMPFETIQRAIAAKNAQADAVAQYTENAVEGLGKIKALPGDAPYLAAKQEDMNLFVDSLVGKDLTDPEVVKAVRNKVGEVTRDPNLSTIAANHKTAEQLLANQSELMKSGKFTRSNMWDAERALTEYNKNGGFASGIQLSSDIYAAEDVAEGARKWFAPIQASGRDSVKALGMALSTGAAKVYYKDGQYGVSSEKIGSVMANNINQMVNSKEGQQAIRDYKMDVESKGGKYDPQKAVQYVYDTFRGIGESFTYSRSETNRDSALNMREQKKEDDAKESATFQADMDKYQNPYGIKGVEFTPSGDIKGSGQKTLWQHVTESPADDTFAAIKRWMGDNGVNPKEAEKFRPIIEGAKHTGMKPEEYYKAINKDINPIASIFAKASKVTDATTVFFNNSLATGTFVHSKIYTPEYPKGIAANEFFKQEFGIDDDEEITKDLLQAKGIQINGSVGPTSLAPAGMAASIGGKSFIIDVSRSVKPDTREGRQTMDRYNTEVAKSKGVHTFQSWHEEGGKLQPIKVKAIYNPKTGKVDYQELD